MTQIMVSIDNGWAVDGIINAIKMLKGVSAATVWKADNTETEACPNGRVYSDRIQKLCQLKIQTYCSISSLSAKGF